MTEHGASVLTLIEEQASRFPERVAVISQFEEMTYRELILRTKEISSRLQNRGVCAETAVAVHANRSVSWIAALLGVLDSGGTYIPLAPISPLHRKARILAAAGAHIVLTDSNDAGMLPAECNCEFLDTTENQLKYLRPTLFSEQAAYGILTSGSTGTPKHVIVNHGSLLHYAEALKQAVPVDEAVRYLHTASIEFSAAMRQILVPLTCGGTLILAAQEEIREPFNLLMRMLQARVTVFDTVPSYLDRWLDSVSELPQDQRNALNSQLALVLTTGEPLTRRHIERMHTTLPGTRVVNLYGQTETTGTVALGSVDPHSPEPVPIGRPLSGTEFYILDHKLAPATEGELYIGGPSLARGYLSNAELTAASFIPNPFCTEPGARMYRTGDRVRMMSDGTFVFLGRSDRQIKFHGIKVDLNEIEQILRAHECIAEAAVLARPCGSLPEDNLVAFVSRKLAADPCGEVEVREYTRNILGETLCPGVITFLDELPRTASGKVDYSALGEIDLQPSSRHITRVPPTTPTEKLIANCWQDILHCSQIGADDDFFALGGHSFHAMQMISVLRRSLPPILPLGGLFFQDPTLRSFAEAIDEETRKLDAHSTLDH